MSPQHPVDRYGEPLHPRSARRGDGGDTGSVPAAMREESGRVRTEPAGTGILPEPETTSGGLPTRTRRELPGLHDGEEESAPGRRPAPQPALAGGRPRRTFKDAAEAERFSTATDPMAHAPFPGPRIEWPGGRSIYNHEQEAILQRQRQLMARRHSAVPPGRETDLGLAPQDLTALAGPRAGGYQPHNRQARADAALAAGGTELADSRQPGGPGLEPKGATEGPYPANQAGARSGPAGGLHPEGARGEAEP